MADEDELDDEMEGEDGEDLDGEGGEDSEKSGGTKKILIIVAVFLLLVVGGFAGAYFTGLLDPVIAWITGGEVEKKPEEEKPLSLSTFGPKTAVTIPMIFPVFKEIKGLPLDPEEIVISATNHSDPYSDVSVVDI